MIQSDWCSENTSLALQQSVNQQPIFEVFPDGYFGSDLVIVIDNLEDNSDTQTTQTTQTDGTLFGKSPNNPTTSNKTTKPETTNKETKKQNKEKKTP